MSVPFGKREEDALIRLADEFSLFHSSWIAPLGKKPAGDGHWLKQRGTPKWRAWSGYAFEGVCLKHASLIKAALGIADNAQAKELVANSVLADELFRE